MNINWKEAVGPMIAEATAVEPRDGEDASILAMLCVLEEVIDGRLDHARLCSVMLDFSRKNCKDVRHPLTRITRLKKCPSPNA